MATTQQELRNDKDKLDLDIATVTAKIETEKLELKELYGTSNPNQKMIDLLEKSLDDLRMLRATLLAERKTITDALTQPNQGTSTRTRNHHRFPFNLCREGGRGSRDFGKEQRAGVHLEPCSLS